MKGAYAPFIPKNRTSLDFRDLLIIALEKQTESLMRFAFFPFRLVVKIYRTDIASCHVHQRRLR
jgi:hypothetical protein